jgi:acyl carrier protein
MANDAMEIRPRIRQFIIKHFPLARKQSSFEDDSPLLYSGIIDSLGVQDLINFIEEEFKITISDVDLQPENFESIASISAFVKSKYNGQLAR